MVADLPILFLFSKLGNLTRVIYETLFCVDWFSILEYMMIKDNGADLLIFRSAGFIASLKMFTTNIKLMRTGMHY